MISDITWVPWLFANVLYTVTLIWAASKFGGSRYGKLWRAFLGLQAVFGASLTLQTLSIVFNMPFSMEEIRPYTYVVVSIASVGSTWYSIKALKMERTLC